MIQTRHTFLGIIKESDPQRKTTQWYAGCDIYNKLDSSLFAEKDLYGFPDSLLNLLFGLFQEVQHLLQASLRLF